jgi:ketosteroid isomerase-like protein
VAAGVRFFPGGCGRLPHPYTRDTARAMSQENVEVVKRIFAEWSKGNFAAGTPVYDENVLLVVHPQFAEPGVFVGMDGVRKYMRGFLDPWEVLTIEGSDFRGAGDSVLVHVVQRGVGRVSGAGGELAYYQLWTLRGGRVIRIELILDEKDALEAIGLSE